jgi:hypothetical protein
MDRMETALYIIGFTAAMLIVSLGSFIMLFEGITLILKKIWK